MKLIEVTCPKCRATMKVDQNKKEMNCEYCGNKFLIDDEVLKVKHINAGEIDEEQEFKNALTYLNFKEYVSAYNSYLSLSKRYVDNPVIWIGLLRSLSEDFTNKRYNSLYESYWNKYSSLANETEISMYKETYEKYMSSFSEYDKLDSKNVNNVNTNEKDYTVLTILGGMFGLHKFARREYGKGFLYLFTAGLFLIGWIYDSIKEVKRHPESKEKAYTCLGIWGIIAGLAYTEYSALGAIIIVIAGILTITPVSRAIWKKPTKVSLYVKLILYIVGFIIVVISMPGYYGEFKGDSMSVIISHDEIKINDNGKGYTAYKYELEDRGDFLLIVVRDSLYTFRYRESKNDLCLYKDNGCVFYLKK